MCFGRLHHIANRHSRWSSIIYLFSSSNDHDELLLPIARIAYLPATLVQVSQDFQALDKRARKREREREGKKRFLSRVLFDVARWLTALWLVYVPSLALYIHTTHIHQTIEP